MQRYRLDEEVNQAIVDGIIKGYLEYLEERRIKKVEMNVSGAYAWTRGNHIDHQISEIGQENGLRFEIKKAGYSWEYLEFSLAESDDPFILIVKNSRPMDEKFDGERKENQYNYLTDYAQMNKSIFNDATLMFDEITEQIELELNSPVEIKAASRKTSLEVSKDYSRFYIVTYKINDVTKMIDSIKLSLPNSLTMELILVEDLTNLIPLSEYEITADLVAPIKEEELTTGSLFSGDFSEIYDVPEEEQDLDEMTN